MRTREKQRILRRFMRGESVASLARWYFSSVKWVPYPNETIENILREGLAGKFDAKPKAGAK
jgi:hypothetical protein